ncbi:alpha/beta fold hydrolase [Streptomyces sp. NBC_01239]|uniref:alpha/beta fold hydrolase n=1 Tax=Streptomyces sp. NBC_01239 TaxID=2903792 RepID=UPI00224CAA50|nr:alpha/beta fold hydrolase [Streptomyces sp. NBC_01239]MCX4815626.1 alpha/beta fold hydrolase [Streptomyces sp. NBC_01239]
MITLHGGPFAGHRPARPWQLAALRMRPVLRFSASAVSLDETLLGQVRYRCKGWNDGDTEQDALRALSELGRLVGDVPVVLVGHAMGGRAALRVASHPQVRGVVALAPWLPTGEPVAQLVGRSVLLVQGHDGRASGVQVWGYAERARAAGARAGVVVVRGGPWMMRRAGVWHRTVASAVRQVSRPTALGPRGVWSSSGPVFV